MDVTDPLRSLEIEDSEDLFKSAFNGSAGRIKITAKPDIDTQQGRQRQRLESITEPSFFRKI